MSKDWGEIYRVTYAKGEPKYVGRFEDIEPTGTGGSMIKSVELIPAPTQPQFKVGEFVVIAEKKGAEGMYVRIVAREWMPVGLHGQRAQGWAYATSDCEDDQPGTCSDPESKFRKVKPIL